MPRSLFPVLLSLVILSLTTSLRASTIYTNGTPITDSNLACRPSCPDLISLSNPGAFTLLQNVTVTGVTFWTFQFPNSYQGGMLDWSIFQDNGGVEGSLIGSGTFTLSQSFVGDVNVAGSVLAEYQNDFAVPNLTIDPSSPSQTYFLDLSDTSGRDNSGTYWASSGNGILAFQVNGTNDNPDPPSVPEPSTFLLIGGGIAVISARQRWLRKQANR